MVLPETVTIQSTHDKARRPPLSGGLCSQRERKPTEVAVQYNQGAKLDPSQMGGGGGRRGGGIAVGGGASILVIILAMIFGFDPSALLGGGSSSSEPAENPFAHCTTGADIADNRECRFVAYTNSVQSYWSQALPGYEMTRTVMFEGSVQTACGMATSEVGPFYCPADMTVYLDSGFFDAMLPRLGARGGDAAEAYVISHEYGHHVQNLTGVLGKVQSAGNQTGPTSPQVRLELQADCYAGVWLRNSTRDPNSPIAQLTADDLGDAVDAALAVGDDRVQKSSSGRIMPETWTHGSSAQRRQWLATGFNTGDPNQCNTFSADALG